jgi:hypothetical protein
MVMVLLSFYHYMDSNITSRDLRFFETRLFEIHSNDAFFHFVVMEIPSFSHAHGDSWFPNKYVCHVPMN